MTGIEGIGWESMDGSGGVAEAYDCLIWFLLRHRPLLGCAPLRAFLGLWVLMWLHWRLIEQRGHFIAR